MARERMVTRTVNMNIVTVLTVDTQTKEVSNRIATIAGTLKDEAEALKKAKVILEDDIVKVVTILSIESKEVLFGMAEDEFIACAKVLPPRTGASTEED